MISDITLGQFFPGFSVLHKLDPRTKIILATIFITAIFLVNNPISFLFILLITAFMVSISRISVLSLINGAISSSDLISPDITMLFSSQITRYEKLVQTPFAGIPK